MENNFQFIDEIILSQKTFFRSGKTLSLDFRKEMLNRLKKMIVENEQEIYEVLKKDLHKSTYESYLSEVGIIIKEINLHLKKIKSWAKPKKVSSPLAMFGSKSYIEYRPLGTVLIISPWNYPFQLPIAPLVGAISSGNCAVLKLSPYSAHTSELIKRLMDRYFEKEYISVLLGGYEVNTELLNRKFDYIFFTGSPSFGKVVAQKAAETLTPVTLELGGKSPTIILNDANLDIAAKRIVWAKFLNSGQTCISPDYLLVHRDVMEALEHKIVREIKVQFGDDAQKSEDYGRMIRKAAFDRGVSMLSEGEVICGGTSNEDDLYIAPTLMKNIKEDSILLTEEIFAPILPMIPFDEIDEVVDYIIDRPKPLALYLFGSDKKNISNILSRIDSGGACINDLLMHIANDNLPFGGVGNSGHGKYHGFFSFETFSNRRSVVKTTTKFDLPVKYGHKKINISLLRKIYE